MVQVMNHQILKKSDTDDEIDDTSAEVEIVNVTIGFRFCCIKFKSIKK